MLSMKHVSIFNSKIEGLNHFEIMRVNCRFLDYLLSFLSSHGVHQELHQVFQENLLLVFWTALKTTIDN